MTTNNDILDIAVSASEGVSPEPVQISPPQEAVSAPDGNHSTTILSAVPATSFPKPHSQYVAHQGSINFRAYKLQKGINGNVYVIKDSPIKHEVPPPESAANIQADIDPLNHVFSAFIDLPVLYTEASIQGFLAMNNKEDTLTQSQMLRSPDSEQFIAAQLNKIRGLENMNVFEYKDIRELPTQAKLLSSIWSYRRKRRPNGELIKHKARICVDGSQQQYGRDYWETYAPVVSWSTVRLVLLLSTILNLRSRQVDYTQAFPQAELPDPVFMRIPQGWYLDKDGKLQPHPDSKHNDTHHYIKLRKNLYG
jgi:hypothetical protein